MKKHNLLMASLIAVLSISAFAEDEVTSDTETEDAMVSAEDEVSAEEEVIASEETEAETESSEVEELDVIGYYIPNEKKETTQISNVLSFEQMSKSGDSNAGDALARVSGLSLGSNKKIIVRGLDDRYSQALLDGSILPSPEPNKRIAPLDLFPTNFMESILVQKTYSPQFPGEYAGGLIELRSKTLPDLPFWRFGGSIGYTEGTTFEDGKTYDGGSYDWTGFDDGTRELPDTIQGYIDAGREIDEITIVDTDGLTQEQLIEAGKSFNNNYSVKEEQNLPNGSISTSFGNRWDVGLNSYGLVGSVSYKNSTKNQSETRATYAAAGEAIEDYDYDYTTKTIELNALVSGGIELGFDNSIKATMMYLRNTTDTAAVKNGDILGEGYDNIETRLEWVERSLFTSQLEGKHYVPITDTSEFSWRANYGFGQRNAPDYRTTLFEDREGDGTFVFDNDSGVNTREYSEIDDAITNIGTRLDIPFLRFQQEGRAYAGLDFSSTERTSDTRRFTFNWENTLNQADFDELPLEEVYTSENIENGAVQLFDATQATDNYKADKTITAGYFQIESPILFNVSATAGFRVESTDMSVSTFDLDDPDNKIKSTINQTDLLPVVTGTWQINDSMQLRGAYSETLARPSFRELSPSAYYDIEFGDPVLGNDELEVSNITNYDARLEWYGNQGDSWSIGGFYKRFDNAIERTVLVSADNVFTYTNIKAANNLGIELEGFYYLSFLSDRLANYSLSGNLTFIDSTVEFTDEQKGLQTNNERAMQGQSDWLANLQFAYENINKGTTFALSYNYTGERIATVGTDGLEDIIDEAHGSVDLSYKSNIPGWTGYQWGFKASNILGGERKFTQDGNVTRQYDEPIGFSISFTRAWEDVPVDIYADE